MLFLLNFLFRKFWASKVLDLAQNVWVLQILLQKTLVQPYRKNYFSKSLHVDTDFLQWENSKSSQKFFSKLECPLAPTECTKVLLWRDPLREDVTDQTCVSNLNKLFKLYKLLRSFWGLNSGIIHCIQFSFWNKNYMKLKNEVSKTILTVTERQNQKNEYFQTNKLLQF